MKKISSIVFTAEFLLVTAGTVLLMSLLIQPAAALTDCTPVRSYQTLTLTACSTGDNLLVKSERDYITFPGGAHSRTTFTALEHATMATHVIPTSIPPQ